MYCKSSSHIVHHWYFDYIIHFSAVVNDLACRSTPIEQALSSSWQHPSSNWNIPAKNVLTSFVQKFLQVLPWLGHLEQSGRLFHQTTPHCVHPSLICMLNIIQRLENTLFTYTCLEKRIACLYALEWYSLRSPAFLFYGGKPYCTVLQLPPLRSKLFEKAHCFVSSISKTMDVLQLLKDYLKWCRVLSLLETMLSLWKLQPFFWVSNCQKPWCLKYTPVNCRDLRSPCPSYRRSNNWVPPNHVHCLPNLFFHDQTVFDCQIEKVQIVEKT